MTYLPCLPVRSLGGPSFLLCYKLLCTQFRSKLASVAVSALESAFNWLNNIVTELAPFLL